METLSPSKPELKTQISNLTYGLRYSTGRALSYLFPKSLVTTDNDGVWSDVITLNRKYDTPEEKGVPKTMRKAFVEYSKRRADLFFRRAFAWNFNTSRNEDSIKKLMLESFGEDQKVYEETTLFDQGITAEYNGVIVHDCLPAILEMGGRTGVLIKSMSGPEFIEFYKFPLDRRDLWMTAGLLEAYEWEQVSFFSDKSGRMILSMDDKKVMEMRKKYDGRIPPENIIHVTRLTIRDFLLKHEDSVCLMDIMNMDPKAKEWINELKLSALRFKQSPDEEKDSFHITGYRRGNHRGAVPVNKGTSLRYLANNSGVKFSGAKFIFDKEASAYYSEIVIGDDIFDSRWMNEDEYGMDDPFLNGPAKVGIRVNKNSRLAPLKSKENGGPQKDIWVGYPHNLGEYFLRRGELFGELRHATAGILGGIISSNRFYEKRDD